MGLRSYRYLAADLRGMIATAATDTIIATVYIIAAMLWVHTHMWADYPQRPVKVWNT